MPWKRSLSWAKLAFNDFVSSCYVEPPGFLESWYVGIGLIIRKHSLRHRASRRMDAREQVDATLICTLLMVMMIAASRRGLTLGKWGQNFGGALLLLTFATLILCRFYGRRGTLATLPSLFDQLSGNSTYNINVFSKLAVGHSQALNTSQFSPVSVAHRSAISAAQL